MRLKIKSTKNGAAEQPSDVEGPEQEPAMPAAAAEARSVATGEAPAESSGYSPPAHRNGAGGSLKRLYTVPERMSEQEREQLAQEEFNRAVAPVNDLLCQAVPDAGSPEEAARLLAERQGEYIPDPDGGAYIAGDAFGEDRRVYYRLLHRDYHPNPRPRGRRTSHRLQDRTQLLPGTRGW